MLKLLNHVTKAALGVVVSPIDMAADILTLGGTLSDREESYTGSRLKNVMQNLDKATDPQDSE